MFDLIHYFVLKPKFRYWNTLFLYSLCFSSSRNRTVCLTRRPNVSDVWQRGDHLLPVSSSFKPRNQPDPFRVRVLLSIWALFVWRPESKPAGTELSVLLAEHVQRLMARGRPHIALQGQHVHWTAYRGCWDGRSPVRA